MHPFLGNWVRQSSVRSCIMPGIPTHLVQDLSVGSVNADFQALSLIQRTNGMLLDLEGVSYLSRSKTLTSRIASLFTLSQNNIMKTIANMF